MEEHYHSLIQITISACQWGANDKAALWDGSAMWHSWMDCRGCRGGKEFSIHKDPLRDCRVGTKLAVVLIHFDGMAGGGCCLVPSEWIDYLGRIGEKVIIIMLRFLHSVKGHYAHIHIQYFLSVLYCTTALYWCFLHNKVLMKWHKRSDWIIIIIITLNLRIP